jgi:[acyl-carrier-protein] S-malonyltransferase
MDKIAFVFAGQGSQFQGMGSDLHEEYESVKEVFRKADIIKPGTSKLCFEASKEELSITANTQPCMYTFEMAIATLLEEKGIVPDAVCGFSLGEVCAISYAGGLSFEKGMEYAIFRANAMDSAAGDNPGKMAAILKLDSKVIEDVCSKYEDVWAVNYNCPGQTVISGKAQSVEAVIEECGKLSGKGIMLAVSGAFHSPYMSSASDAVAKYLETITPGEIKIPLYTNVTGKVADYSNIKNLMAEQISSPVLWSENVESMIADGVGLFVEIGPGKVLSGLISKINSEVKVCNIQDLKSLELALETIYNFTRAETI